MAKKRFYCRFRTGDGTLLSWKTGQTTKAEAENWAIDHLAKVASVKEKLTFKGYSGGVGDLTR